jgi:hypothetical protein
MAVHQTARFLIKPMRLHKLAIMRVGRFHVTLLKEASYIKSIRLKVLRFMQTPILPEDGVLLTQKTRTVFYLELVLLFVMQTVL